MRKIITMLAVGAVSVICSTTAYAATNPDVYYTESLNNETSYTVSVETNGKATDGLTEITYDSTVLNCEEDDIIISDNVDISSVNVENGVIKVAYVSEDAIEEGAIFSVTFDVAEGKADDVAVNVTSVANAADGSALSTGKEATDEPVTPDEPVAPETPVTPEDTETPGAPADTETPATPGTSANAGTSSNTSNAGNTTSTTSAVSNAAAQIANIPENGTLTVAMGTETTVSKDLLNALKGQNKTVVFKMANGISWSINGASITGNVADINLDVAVGNSDIPDGTVSSLAAGRQVVELSLAFDGDFGCEAVMSISMGSDNAGKYANLYYYNPETGKMEFVTSALIGADGSAALTFTHASDYAIVIDTVSTKGASTGDVPYATVGICVLLAGLAVVAFAMKKKKVQ